MYHADAITAADASVIATTILGAANKTSLHLAGALLRAQHTYLQERPYRIIAVCLYDIQLRLQLPRS